MGRAAGFLPDKVSLLVDTTPVGGAGAVQDTYTLLRKGVRKLLKAAGFAVPGKQQGLSPQSQRLVATYLEQDRKAEIDWSDAQQRLHQLQQLMTDAEAALDRAAVNLKRLFTLIQAKGIDLSAVLTTGCAIEKFKGDQVRTSEGEVTLESLVCAAQSVEIGQFVALAVIRIP